MSEFIQVKSLEEFLAHGKHLLSIGYYYYLITN